MGVINLAIKLKRLVTKVNKIGKEVDALKPVNVVLEGTSGTMEAKTFEHMCDCIKLGVPVTIKVDNDGSVSRYLGFYASYNELEEYISIVFGKQGNEESLSFADNEWELM